MSGSIVEPPGGTVAPSMARAERKVAPVDRAPLQSAHDRCVDGRSRRLARTGGRAPRWLAGVARIPERDAGAARPLRSGSGGERRGPDVPAAVERAGVPARVPGGVPPLPHAR